MITHMIYNPDSNSEDKIDLDVIFQTVYTFMIAGTDTTANYS